MRRLKPEKESIISSDVFWSLIQFYYVVKPNLQNFESFFNFFSAAIPFLRPTSTQSSWLSSQLIAYAQQFLTPSFSIPADVKLNALRGDTSFIIPSNLLARTAKVPWGRTVLSNPDTSSGVYSPR